MAAVFQLAQVNIGRIRAPLTDPIMDGFVSQLATINALADNAPGFVWRLQTPAGDATLIHVYDDPRIIINMSVWESVEALWNFSYKSDHTPFIARRKDWFERLDTAYMTLWWIPAGSIPTPEEAKAKLELLDRNGPTAEAFTFKERFPAPVTETES